MFLRKIAVYRDVRGRSQAEEQLARVAKSDACGSRAIEKKIRLLRKLTWDQALQSRLIKKPTSTIYVLRVQSGPVSYRLPFFEPLCRGGKLIVFTHCERRADLSEAAYAALIKEAERRRQDWIARNCKEG